MPFAGSKRSTMAVVPAHRQSCRVKKRKSGSDGYVQNDWKLCIGATIGTRKARRIDGGQTLSPKSSGSSWAGSSSDFSGSETSRGSPRGNSARIASKESRFLAAPQHSNTSKSLAHAIIRGFKVRAAKKLPEFLERRASPSNATTENMVAIKEVHINLPYLHLSAALAHRYLFLFILRWSSALKPLAKYSDFLVTTRRRGSHNNSQSGRSTENHWNKWRLICWNALDDSTLRCQEPDT